MKRNRTSRLVVFVLFLAIVTAIIISGTFAKYTSSESGTGTAEIAKWSFTATGLDNAVTLTRTTVTDKIADGKLAPGTEGNFSLGIDATGCEVAIDYKVEISNVQNKPTNLKFYSDSAYTTEISEVNGVYSIEGTMTLTEIAATPTKSIPVYWKWEYETSTTDANDDGVYDDDVIDTTEGIAAADMTFDISVIGTQADPTK